MNFIKPKEYKGISRRPQSISITSKLESKKTIKQEESNEQSIEESVEKFHARKNNSMTVACYNPCESKEQQLHMEMHK